MRRNDREVTSMEEIYDILCRCDTVRIGISADPVYIVPMSFGCELKDGSITIYTHCAKEGMKLDLLSRNDRVCIEADICQRIDRERATAYYESIIGFGTCRVTDEPGEVRNALKSIMGHYGADGAKVDRCVMSDMVSVMKIELDSVTGKRRLP